MFAWAASAVGSKADAAFDALANHAKGGKLWSFTPDQLCAVFWAFTKTSWRDVQLFWDLVHVARERTNEFDGDCLANLVWSLTALQRSAIDTSSFDLEIKSLLDFALEAALPGRIAFPNDDSSSMAVWSFCKLDRIQDALMLFFNEIAINRMFKALHA